MRQNHNKIDNAKLLHAYLLNKQGLINSSEPEVTWDSQGFNK